MQYNTPNAYVVPLSALACKYPFIYEFKCRYADYFYTYIKNRDFRTHDDFKSASHFIKHTNNADFERLVNDFYTEFKKHPINPFVFPGDIIYSIHSQFVASKFPRAFHSVDYVNYFIDGRFSAYDPDMLSIVEQNERILYNHPDRGSVKVTALDGSYPSDDIIFRSPLNSIDNLNMLYNVCDQICRLTPNLPSVALSVNLLRGGKRLSKPALKFVRLLSTASCPAPSAEEFDAPLSQRIKKMLIAANDPELLRELSIRKNEPNNDHDGFYHLLCGANYYVRTFGSIYPICRATSRELIKNPNAKINVEALAQVQEVINTMSVLSEQYFQYMLPERIVERQHDDARVFDMRMQQFNKTFSKCVRRSTKLLCEKAPCRCS